LLHWSPGWGSGGGTHVRAYVMVARSKKFKKVKFGHKKFQKGQVLKNEKRTNKGQIFFKKLLK